MSAGDALKKRRPYVRPEVKDLGSLSQQAEAMGLDCLNGNSATGSGGGGMCVAGSVASQQCQPGSVASLMCMGGSAPS
jgi:hypothetical protein